MGDIAGKHAVLLNPIPSMLTDLMSRHHTCSENDRCFKCSEELELIDVVAVDFTIASSIPAKFLTRGSCESLAEAS